MQKKGNRLDRWRRIEIWAGAEERKQAGQVQKKETGWREVKRKENRLDRCRRRKSWTGAEEKKEAGQVQTKGKDGQMQTKRKSGQLQTKGKPGQVQKKGRGAKERKLKQRDYRKLMFLFGKGRGFTTIS